MVIVKKQHASYRSRDEVYYQVLSAIKEYEPTGIIRTRLMMLSHITNVQLKRRLEELLDNELIQRDSTLARPVAASATINYRRASVRGERFHITQKGLRYLEMLDEMKRSMPPGEHI